MAIDESCRTLSVYSANDTAAVAGVTNAGAGTALQVSGGGTLLDVKTLNGSSRLKVTQTAPTVSGAKGSNAALGSLITALVSMGLIIDTTTT